MTEQRPSISIEIRTARLWLRRWRPEDRDALADMGANPVVMQHFPSLLTREESDALADRIEKHFAEKGFGLWALEIPGVAPFAGFVGLFYSRFSAPFTPCVEAGWRLMPKFWGQGFAVEAARACIEFGFRELALPEILAFTVPDNVRSRRVMEKIGMKHEPDMDFDHPLVPIGNPCVRHVFYRVRAGFPETA